MDGTDMAGDRRMIGPLTHRPAHPSARSPIGPYLPGTTSGGHHLS
jgi:hypothetical protein